MIPTPIGLLLDKYTELQRTLHKSEELFEAKEIDYHLYNIHKKNLLPKIKEYKSAIDKLLDYG